MKSLSKPIRALLCAFLTSALLLSPQASFFAGLSAAPAPDAANDLSAEEASVVHFKTSFEEDEPELSARLIESENVVQIEYGIQGKGLAVRLDTLEGSEDYIGSENKFNLFDAKTSTKFLTDNSTSVVWFALKTPAAVCVYEIASANDAPGRDPRDWTLYGSNDGKTWTALDVRTGESFANRFQTKRYSFENTTVYAWYKLDVTKNAGDGMTQYASLELYDGDPGQSTQPVPTDDDPFKVVTASVKGTSTVSTAEGKDKLFDGETTTKATFIGSTAWVSFKVNRADPVLSYIVSSANDAPLRDPKNWTLYGSTDGKTWVALDEQSDVSFSGRFEEKLFTLNAPASYLWYKFDVTKNSGADDYTQLSELTLRTAADEEEKYPGVTVKKDFGPMQPDNGKAGAWTGVSCLAVFGEQTDKKHSHARAAVFEGLNIPVSETTTLSYLIFPALFKLKTYDYEYTSCRVIIDLHFTDGSYLSQLGARDQNGSPMSPAGQVAGECLYTAQWNYIESDIGAVACGKTIDRVDVYFEMDDAEDASKFITFFDDLTIEDKKPPVYEHLSDYINILRGTNNDGAFSRGLCTPGVTVPNGFNFYSPVTEPSKPTASYNYQVNGNNNPLDSITVIHIPSNWLSSYGTWQFMPNTSEDLSGTVTAEMLSSDARKAKFTHENEIARAHYYSVTLNEGSAASGVKIEITPTGHAAYVRITFPAGAENVNLIFDSLWGSGTVKFDEDGRSFNATTNHTAAGNTRMYVYGEFDVAPEKTSVVSSKKAAVVFPQGTTVLNMKISTSFISLNQAKHSMELEIGDKDFEGVFAEAQSSWDALCGKFEIEGASYTQLVNFYSSVYRMYAYPNLYSENEGTNENPVWVYASPYKSGKKTSGILYTVNGFWDTYRTTWAGYSLFTAEKDGEMLNGLVQHYIDSGWLPRWICPGGVDCMVGTSSDIIFADAYIKGIDFNYQKAWESMVENASAYSANMSAGGRPDNNLTPFLGYVANTTTQGFSSSIESYINDYGLYRMAEKMGLTNEAEYYRNRALKYPILFNADVGFFMGKDLTGTFSAKKSNYDPAAWGGPKEDYTESVGWVNAFPAVFDGEGLVALYGGREALAAKLNTMFDDSPAAMRKVVSDGVHEITEFKEVKMGQYEHNNQPAHHIIYTYAFSSEPWHVQEYTREVLRHVYVGAEIGQGFPGDEDNGEMSAWYIFNALGFYPYCLASGEYVIGSPLFDKVTVHLDNGNDIVIIAHNNSQENVYIQSAKVNGENYGTLYLTHETLTSGCVIEYEMGSEPCNFGTDENARPSSLTGEAEQIEEYKQDVTNNAKLHIAAYDGSLSGSGKHIYTEIADAAQLFDGSSTTAATIADGDSVTFVCAQTAGASMLTLSSYDKTHSPKGVKVEVSNDGVHFKTVYENNALSFKFGKFVVPYAIPENERGKYFVYRVTLTGGTKLAEIELLGSEEALNESDLELLAAYLSADDETQRQTPDGSLFRPDVTDSALSVRNLTILLNMLAG